MRYILFVLIFSGNGPVVHTQEFNSEASCRTAALSIDTARLQAHWKDDIVRAFCVSDIRTTLK